MKGNFANPLMKQTSRRLPPPPLTSPSSYSQDIKGNKTRRIHLQLLVTDSETPPSARDRNQLSPGLQPHVLNS